MQVNERHRLGGLRERMRRMMRNCLIPNDLRADRSGPRGGGICSPEYGAPGPGWEGERRCCTRHPGGSPRPAWTIGEIRSLRPPGAFLCCRSAASAVVRPGGSMRGAPPPGPLPRTPCSFAADVPERSAGEGENSIPPDGPFRESPRGAIEFGGRGVPVRQSSATHCYGAKSTKFRLTKSVRGMYSAPRIVRGAISQIPVWMLVIHDRVASTPCIC
jgi:hypothetical protein